MSQGKSNRFWGMTLSRARVALMLALAAAGPAAGAADTVEQALRASELILDWRVRYETVSHAAFADDAQAGTSRLRLGFQTAPWRNSTLLVEGVWVEDFVDDYNSTINGQTGYPVVPDPAGYTAVNRFAISNTSLPGTRLTLGRQRIVLDDARFVGNVGWRQKEQTFDALRAQWSPAAWSVDLSYATQVNRVFGPRSPVGRWDGDFVLGQAARATGIGRLTLFGYHVGTDDAAANSSDTFGARLAGTRPLDRLAVTWAAAWATQRDAGDNPFSYRARYTLLEGGARGSAGGGNLSGALGQERLGGNGQRAFTTPLATLQAFLGWADLYLDTPPDGIVDRYLRVGYERGRSGPFSALAVLAVLHDFRAARGGARYGEEFDIQLTARLERLALGLKYARYAANGFGADVDKLWLSLEFGF
jgi:hypothetical protein